MSFGLECRVPFLDKAVVKQIQKIPPYLRISDETPKILLRLILADLFENTPEFAIELHKRRPCPAFLATKISTQRFRQSLSRKMCHSKLASSKMAAYVKNDEELFWFASVEYAFTKHKGNVGGMTFNDLEEQVLNQLPV
jgi:asparagine synthetase B (glutamine-hydrolysing)